MFGDQGWKECEKVQSRFAHYRKILAAAAEAASPSFAEFE
jgi:hypothetical protein